jgi:filamentous hemagglutinin family protein
MTAHISLIANHHCSRKAMIGIAVLTAIAWGNVFAAPETNALPTGGRVSAGAATISSTSGSAPVMTVNQSSQRAVVDWNKFDVGQNATVKFNQPNAQASTLNKIADANPSQVFGKIQSNGEVVLVNQAGVYFSPSASVDVGSVVATTHNISNDDYMAGKSNYDRNGSTGKVINEGKIQAALGGYVAMLAPEVRNSGIIIAKMGSVVLASGERITLNFDANKRVSTITTTPSTIAALVENKSAVKAPGGLIILSAQAMNQLAGGVIQQSGTLTASASEKTTAGLSKQGGRIILDGGDVTVAAGSKTIANGVNGGGSVEIKASNNIIVETGAKIAANAKVAGDGGKIIIMSGKNTVVDGKLSAQGGTQYGNGGLIETSSKEVLQLGNNLSVNAGSRSSSGKSGTWLLDPFDLIINSFAAQIISNVLNSSNVRVEVNNLGCTAFGACTSNGSGNLTLANGANIEKTSGNKTSLTLVATGNIDIFGNILSQAGASLDVFMEAGSQIHLDANAQIQVNKIEAKAQAIQIQGSVFSYGADINNSSPLIALLAGRISISGVLRANARNTQNSVAGKINIQGEDEVAITNATIEASGGDGGEVTIISSNGSVNMTQSYIQTNGGQGRGGAISVAGLQQTTINATTLEATGQEQGGTILIGNDAKNGTLPFSVYTSLDAQSIINASQLTSATSNQLGGFVETSGHTLNLLASINAGRGGMWLLDPANVFIDSSGSLACSGSPTLCTSSNSVSTANIVAALGAGSNVKIIANDSSSSSNGDIYVKGNIDCSACTGNAYLALLATGSIVITADIKIKGSLYLGGTGLNPDTATTDLASYLGVTSMTPDTKFAKTTLTQVPTKAAAVNIGGAGCASAWTAECSSASTTANSWIPVTITSGGNIVIAGNGDSVNNDGQASGIILTSGSLLKASGNINLYAYSNGAASAMQLGWGYQSTAQVVTTGVNSSITIFGFEGYSTPTKAVFINGVYASSPTISIYGYGGAAVAGNTAVSIGSSSGSTNLFQTNDFKVIGDTITFGQGGNNTTSSNATIQGIDGTTAGAYWGAMSTADAYLPTTLQSWNTSAITASPKLTLKTYTDNSNGLKIYTNTYASGTPNGGVNSTSGSAGTYNVGDSTWMAVYTGTAITSRTVALMLLGNPSGLTLGDPDRITSTPIVLGGDLTVKGDISLYGKSVDLGTYTLTESSSNASILIKAGADGIANASGSAITTASGVTGVNLELSQPITQANSNRLDTVISGGIAVTFAGNYDIAGANTYTGDTTTKIQLNGANLKFLSGYVVSGSTITSSPIGKGNLTLVNGTSLDLNGYDLGSATTYISIAMKGRGTNTANLRNKIATSVNIYGNITFDKVVSTEVPQNIIEQYLGATMTVWGLISDCGTCSPGTTDYAPLGIGTSSSNYSGTVVFANTNTYSGKSTVKYGILKAGSATPFGTGDISVSSGAALDLNGQTITSTGNLTLNGTGISNSGVLINSSTTTATYPGLVTLAGSTTITGDTGKIILSNTGMVTGATFGLTLGGAQGGSIASIIGTTSGPLTKQDAGTWTLSGANTYTGITTINNGVLSVTTLANGGSASGIGQSTSAAANLVINGGTLQYTGAAVSTDRLFTLGSNGGAIDASGTGELTWNGNGSGSANAIAITTASSPTLTLTGSGFGTLRPILPNAGTGYTSRLTKSGTGTWTLLSVNTYTGDTNINDGVLKQGINTPFAAGVTINSNGTLDLAGFIYSDKAITLNGGTINSSTGSGAIKSSGVLTRITLTADSKLSAGTGAFLYMGQSGGGGFKITGGYSITIGDANNRGTVIYQMTAASDYSGGTVIDYGKLALNNYFSPPSTGFMGPGTVTVNANGILDIFDYNVSNNIILNGGILTGGSTSTTGIPTYSGVITLTANSTIAGYNRNSGVSISTGGIISSGNYGVTIGTSAYNGVVNFYAVTSPQVYSYTGDTIIAYGTLNLSSDIPVTSSSLLRVDTNGALRLTGSTFSKALTLNGGSLISSTSATINSVITLTADSKIAVVNGQTATLSATGSISGNFGLTYGVAATNVYTGIYTTPQLSAGSFSTNTYYVINSLGTTDFTLIGASSNTVGTQFKATGAGTGTGTAITANSPTNYNGIVKVSSSNSYTGVTNIAYGTLRIGAAGTAPNSPLGTVDGGTVVASGATLDLYGLNLATDEPLTLNGTGVSNGGALKNSYTSASSTYKGLVTLGSSSSIVAGSKGIVLSNTTGQITGDGYTLSFDGEGEIKSVIATGAGGVTKTGTAYKLVLSGLNTYTGPTKINGGFVSVSTLADGGFASGIGQSTNAASNLVFGGSDAKLEYTGGTVSTDRLFTLNSNAYVSNQGTGTLTFSNTGNIVNATSTAGTYTFNLYGNTQNGVFNPVLVDGSSTATLAVSLLTSGKWTLGGSNTYSAGTTITAGTLQISSDANLGAVPNSPTINITFGGGRLLASGHTSALTIHANRNISLGTGPTSSSNGTIANNSTVYTLNIAGIISGTSYVSTGNVTSGLTIGSSGNTGTVILSGNNVYSSGTKIAFGTLQFGSAYVANGTTITSSPVGTRTMSGSNIDLTVAIQAGAALDLNGYDFGSSTYTNTSTFPSISLLGIAGASQALLINSSATPATVYGVITLDKLSYNAVAQAASGSLTVAAVIKECSTGCTGSTGTSTSLQIGARINNINYEGTVIFSGANTFSAASTISYGTLKLGSSYIVSGSSTTSSPIGKVGITIGAGANLDLNGQDFGSSLLTTNPTITMSGTDTTAQALLMNSSATSVTVYAPITLSAVTTANTLANVIAQAGSSSLTVVARIYNSGATASGLQIGTNIGGTDYAGKVVFTGSAVTASGSYTGLTSVNSYATLDLKLDSINTTTSASFNSSYAGAGTIIIEPLTAGGTIALGGTGSTLNLASTLFSGGSRKFADGFTNIIIGDSTSGAITISGNNSFSDSVTLISSGNITINSSSSVTSSQASGNLVLAATGNFINSAGANALNTSDPGSSDHWIVYSASPSTNTFGGLVSGNKAYWGSTYSTLAPSAVGTGNRYVFSDGITLTTTNASKRYGETVDLSSNYTLTGNYTTSPSTYGNVYLAISDSDILSTLPTITAASSADSDTNAAVGTYAISASGAVAKTGYSFSYASTGNGILTVNPAAVTLGMVGSKTYDGTALFNGNSLTVSGLANGDTLATATANSANVADNGSNYFVSFTLSSGTASNYVLVNGYDATTNAATINKAPAYVLVTAGQSSTYGSTPTINYTFYNNASGTGGSAITTSTTGTASFTNGPVAGSNAGTYALTYASGLTADNYELNPATSAVNYVVNKATIVLNSSNTTTTYDGTAKQNSVTATVNGTATSFSSLPAGASTISGGGPSAPITNSTSVGNYIYLNTSLGSDSFTISGAANSTNAGTTADNFALTAYAANGTLASNYNIVYNNRQLVINPAPLGVSVTGTYSGSTTITPTSFQLSGLVNNETVTALASATVNNPNVSSNGANYVTALVSGGGTADLSNYVITAGYQVGSVGTDTNSVFSGSTSGTATNAGGTNIANLNKATLTITADADSKTYGSVKTYGASSAAFTSSGLVNSETIGSVTITDTNNGRLATANAGGTYALTPSLATGGTFNPDNYIITYTDGALTVNTKSLTVAAASQSTTYGTALVLGTNNTGTTRYTVTGLVNSDAVTAVDLQYSGNGTVAATTAANTYTNGIVASNATGTGLSNYTISYGPADLVVNTKALTITANSDSKTYGTTKTYGAGSTAFTSSGLANSETIGSVTITDTNSGGLVTANAGGSYALTPSAATGGTFTASNYSISYTAGALTVGKATLTVTADAKSMTYGGSSLPTLTATITGFVNSQNLGTSGVTGSANLSTTATAYDGSTAGSASVVGNYTITPTLGTLAASNYDFTYATGTLSVGKANLTITAANDSKTYGATTTAANVAYTSGVAANASTGYTTSGLMNGDTISSVTLSSAGANATATVAGGPYTITPSGLAGSTRVTSANYNITYTNASTGLTVNPATLTYTATAATSIYGSTPSVNAGSVTGFVNGDTQGTATTGTLVFTTSATDRSNVGSYAINGSGLTSSTSNYVFAQASGNATALTINPFAVTIEAGRYYNGTRGISQADFMVPGGLNANGERVFVATGNATVSSANAGNYSNVTFSNLTIRVDDGFGNSRPTSNYTFNTTGGVQISPAPLTISPDAKSMTYGGTVPTLTYTYTGQVTGETPNFTGSLYVNATSTSGVGSYSIDLNTLQATGNYQVRRGINAEFIPANLVVNPAPLNLSISKVYSGTTGFTSANDYTVTGMVNNDVAPTVSGSAVTSSANVGTYTSFATSNLAPSNSNYTFIGGNISATITPATLTYNATPTSSVYGVTPSVNLGTVTGFVNNENASVLTGSLSFTTTATTSSPIGQYAINGSGLNANHGNYVFVQAAANATALNITQANLVITPNNQTGTYGTALNLGTSAFTTTGLLSGDSVTSVTLLYGGNATVPAMLAAGTYANSISASGATGSAGISNYSITYNTANLTINKATLTVTADNKSRVYGDVNPSLTYTITGYQNSENATSAGVTGTANISTTALQGSNVGTYAITAAANNLAAANYQFSYVDGTLTVNRRPVTVTADNQSKIYGDVNPILSYTVAANGVSGSRGMYNDQTLVGELAASADQRTNVGTIPITQGTLTNANNGNYDITFNNGTLTINPAQLTVTANADAKFVTQSDASNFKGVNYTGFVNGDTASSLGGTLSVTRSNTSVNSAGVYNGVLQASGLTSNNYTITYATGNYTIIPAQTLLVDVNNQTITYGATPTFGINSVKYLDGQNVIHTLTQTAHSGDTYTYSDGVGGSATFTLTTGAGLSSSSHLVVGNYSLLGTNYTKIGNNFNNDPVYTGNLAVQQKALTASTASVSKVYDGSASMANLNISLAPIVSGDVVGASGQGAFSQAGVGANLNYSVNNLVLIGADAANYYLSGGMSFSGSNGEITKAPLGINVTASYNGTTTVTPTAQTITGLVNNETMIITSVGLNSAKVADNSTNYVTSILASSGTASMANYELNVVRNAALATSTTNKAMLDPVAITVTANNQSRVYGSANPTSGAVTLTSGQLYGGDTLSTASLASAATSTTAAGQTATLVPSSQTFTVTDAAQNYTITYASGTLSVNKAPIGVAVTGTYSGTTSITPTSYTITGLANGETLVPSAVTVNNKNVAANGSNYVTAMTPTAGSTASLSNYEFTLAYNGVSATTMTNMVTMNKANLAINATPSLTGKIYNGTAYTGTYTTTALNGETFTVTGMATGTDAATYTSNLVVTGAALANYNTPTITNANLVVSPKPVTITNNASASTYDGATTYLSRMNLAGFTNTALVGSDTISAVTQIASVNSSSVTGVAQAGTFTSTPSSAVLGTGLASNYDFTYVAATNTVAKANLTITASNATKTYDGLAYVGGNGVSYTGLVASETSSVLGGALAYGGSAQNAINAGAYTISPSGLTSNNYNINFVGGALMVNARALTIAANDPHATYGTALALGTSAYTITSGSLATGDAISAVTLQYQGNATVPVTVNAGSYANSVVASGATGTGGFNTTNYSITYIPGMLIVNKAMLTVTANNQSRVYGDANPTFTQTISGFVNGQTLATSGVTGTAYGTTGATSSSAVNSYTINASATGLTSNNYQFTTVNGTLTVTPRPITVTADAQTKVYGSANPSTLTYTVAADGVGTSRGLYGSDTLSGALSVNAGTTTPVGNVAILQNTLSNTNYAITYVSDNLSITPATLTVTGYKTYDGSIVIQGSDLTVAGVNGERFTAGGNANLNSKNVQVNQNLADVNGITLTPLGGALVSNYLPLNVVNTQFTVYQKAVTLSAPSITKTYDGGYAYTMTLTDLATMSSQLVGGDMVSSATVVYANKDAGTNKRVDLNSVTISDGNGGANYSVTMAASNAGVITKAPLVIKAADDAKFVTTADTVGYAGVFGDGFVNGEGLSNLTAPATIVTRSNASVNNAGNYVGVLVPGVYTSNNYDISYQNGTYTIVPALTLLIRVSPTTVTYGDITNMSAPAYTYTAQYLPAATVNNPNPTPVSLATPAPVNGVYSINDNVGSTATFGIGAVNPEYSSTNRLVVGGYDMIEKNAVVTGNNFLSMMTVGALTVNPKVISATNLGIASVTKVYNGDAAISGVLLAVNAANSQVLSGDRVDVYATGTYTDADVGLSKSVVVDVNLNTPANLINDAKNYSLSSTRVTGNLGAITQLAQVTWTGVGSNSNWSNSSNWAGGATPTFSIGANVPNVASVIIPAGANVIYDSASVGNSGSAITNNGTIIFNGANNFTWTDSVSGSGGISLTGAGTLTLTGNNTYTGGTNIHSSRLMLGAANALAGNAVTSSGGRLGLLDGVTLPSLTVNGDVTLVNGGLGSVGEIRTAGAQIYNGKVGLGQNLKLTGSSVTFNDSVGKVGTVYSNYVANHGSEIYDLEVLAGSIFINADITTYGTQTYGSGNSPANVVIGGNGTNGTVRTLISEDPEIKFYGTINDSVANTHDLMLKSVAYISNQMPKVSINGDVGLIKPLKTLTVATGLQKILGAFAEISTSQYWGSISLVGNVTTLGNQEYTSNEITIGTNVQASSYEFTSTEGRVIFNTGSGLNTSPTLATGSSYTISDTYTASLRQLSGASLINSALVLSEIHRSGSVANDALYSQRRAGNGGTSMDIVCVDYDEDHNCRWDK